MASQFYFLPYSLSMYPLAWISSSKLASKKSVAFAPLVLGFGRESKAAWSHWGSGTGYALKLFSIFSYVSLAALGSFKLAACIPPRLLAAASYRCRCPQRSLSSSCAGFAAVFSEIVLGRFDRCGHSPSASPRDPSRHG